MTAATPARFPFAPLERQAELRFPEQDRERNGQPKTPAALLFHAAGLGRHLISRWRRDGVPLDGADRLAMALGEHPCAVWPEWWDVEA